MKPAQFCRILCPVSFSDTSRRTVEMAAMLAAGYDAELRLFHAVPAGAHADADVESLMGALFALTRQMRTRVRISAAIGYGEAAAEIHEHARLMGADLIVMGLDVRPAPHGCGDSLALTVASHAACPVLVVRPTSVRFPTERWKGFTEILSCIDFLPASLEGADYALALAARAHARVTLVNVLSDPDEEILQIEDLALEVRRSLDAIRTAAHSSHGVEAVITGPPGPEIVGFAGRVGSDLVVLAAHSGVQPVRRIGATAAYVARHASCPVLIVPVGADVVSLPLPGSSHSRRSERA